MALARIDGTLYRVNAALRAILGSDESGLLGLGLGALGLQGDRAVAALALTEVLAGRADSSEEETRWQRPGDGSSLWARVVCTLVRHAAPRTPSHLIVQVTDVTLGREQREPIEAAHAFQQAVLAASPDVLHVGASTRKRSCGPASR